MMLAPARVRSTQGLSGTLAWTDKDGPVYALEGNITVSGQASAFMATILGATGPEALSELAQTVESSAGVVFVPALAGLGAPHWANDATGLITGMTHGTLPAHLARAAFEAIALQVADVVDAMAKDAEIPIFEVRADGGATSNASLMQLQANILDRNVVVSNVEEIGALGVAAMAFAALGVSLTAHGAGHVFSPNSELNEQLVMRKNWHNAVKQCLSS